jgi:hypothetical protein
VDKKCLICRKDPDPNCTWNQGRCPHRVPIAELPSWKKLGILLIAPFIIGAWCVMHPKKVWEQAKKEWNL